MKTEKKIKKAYEKLPVPNAEDVLPEGTANDAAEKAAPKRRFAPRFAYALASAILIVGIISAGMVALFRNGALSGNTGADTDAPVYKDGVIGGKKSTFFGFSSGISYKLEESKSGMTAPDGYGYYGEAPEDADSYWIPENGPLPAAGLLTASEWSDVKHLSEWIGRFSDADWASYADSRGLASRGAVEVSVANADGALYNAEVELLDADGNTVWTARTNISGKAYLYYPESLSGSSGSVRVGGETKEIVLTSGAESHPEASFTVADGSVQVTKLDLMLMIDTTGSMGDELEYLKAELADMVSRISSSDGALSVRVSVNFYRDEGDDYVVKYFDFREDIEECLAQMAEQYASGGGDFPEAVHTALENAVTGHTWRDEAVKLCYLVLDAPPHKEYEIQGINKNIMDSLSAASSLGVRIIPVASSGVTTETEVILRSFAAMTGGTYIWLTNDSGIGGEHLEATVSEKDVEPLNECMVRVACEYCGIEYKKVNETSGETKIYTITYAQDLSNCLTDAPKSAKAGETVEIRAEADSDVRLYLNGGEEIERFVGQDRVPVFTFTMPEYSVIITDEEMDF